MTDNIHKQNVYSRGISMWHLKGIVGQIDESFVSVCNRMDKIEFEKREYSIVLNGQTVGSKQFAIVRMNNGNERIIGTTKDDFQLVQPLEYCEIYDRACGVPCETLGFLGTDGEKMFMTSKLPSISIYGDVINLFQFVAVGFDGLFGVHQYLTEVRVVCENTHNRAIAESNATNNHGRGALYSGRHNQPNHKRDLEAWLAYVQKQTVETAQITQDLFCKMESTKMTIDQAFGLTQKVYPDPNNLPDFYPDELREEKQESIDKKIAKAMEDRDLVMDLFKGTGIQITPTAYGFLNSVKEAENRKPSKKDTTYSTLIGNRHLVMENAANIVTDWTNEQNK
jgi:hypothetical protein